MILAVDTAGDRCSVALEEGGLVVRELAGAPGHARLEHVLPLVHDLLEARGGPGACEAFAFGAGPGAFSGLRVSCTLVQGFALACDRPVVPVGNLEAIAHRALEAPDGARSEGSAFVAIDARLGEAYFAVYRQPGGGGPLESLRAPAICPVGELETLVAHWSPDVIGGNAFALSGAGGGDCARERCGVGAARVRRSAVAQADAGAIAILAREKLGLGLAVAARDAVPLYVRDRVAATVAERAAGVYL
jgi:tRNA threonylcarbamoyladenosine biosynthesis protein TsaB